ncbi:MAG: hypothetical protein ABI467_09110 [Kofleriaceae bacterium]
MGGFSFASVILSYFLTAGGLLTGSILITKLHTTSEVVALLCWAIGSFIGGFFAARASRGSTIIEPAIGAVLVVATLVISVMGGESAREMWHAGGGSIGKFVAEVTAALVIGAVAGAFVSEKAFGEATTSGVPWILYSALTSLGAMVMAAIVFVILAVRGDSSPDKLATMVIVGTVAGALLGGVAIGASARMRVMGPAFLGGAFGVVALSLLSLTAGNGASIHDSSAVAGLAIIALVAGLVTMLGAGLGWVIWGKKNAG